MMLDAPTGSVNDGRVHVTGVPLVVTNPDAFVRRFVTGVRTAGALPLRFVNAYSLALGSKDERYREVLLGPGLNLPDGKPVGTLVRWKARNARGEVGQVRGPSFFPAVLDAGRETGVRHFLLGGTDASIERLVDVIGTRYPGAAVAGWWAPPFGPVDEALLDEAAHRVHTARADVVWVSLGTPKQDFAAVDLAGRVGLPVVGIGAAFDFESGAVRHAPAWMRAAGLEWLHRLLSEPKRLWRRYVFGNTRFLLEVVTSELRARGPVRGSRVDAACAGASARRFSRGACAGRPSRRAEGRRAAGPR